MVGYSLPGKLRWLDVLLSERFFVSCDKHATIKKNERNVFCVDCSSSICQHCLCAHRGHRLVQVRRYVYHDVVRIQDMEKLVDCGHVQTYIINGARVVFLNQRPQLRPSTKGLSNSCHTCERSLQDPYRFCSIACKVFAVVRQKKDLASWLLPGSQTAQEVSTVQSFKTDSPEEEECRHWCQSDDSGCDSSPVTSFQLLMLPTPPAKRSRSSRHPSPKSVLQRHSQHLQCISRRKGVPRRSPLS